MVQVGTVCAEESELWVYLTTWMDKKTDGCWRAKLWSRREDKEEEKGLQPEGKMVCKPGLVDWLRSLWCRSSARRVTIKIPYVIADLFIQSKRSLVKNLGSCKRSSALKAQLGR